MASGGCPRSRPLNGEKLAPLAPGSISLGLAAHDLGPAGIVELLRQQARAADDAGFDGVTLSEHHGGFPGYVPNPVQMAGWLLAAMPRAWAAACPTLLPLRSPALVIEDVAWLAAAFPGRAGVGFAPGYQQRDFAIAGQDFASRRQRYWQALDTVTKALSGADSALLADDPAVAGCRAAPIPVVSAAGSPKAAARAASAGAGILITSLTDVKRAREITGAYDDAGGSGTRIVIRRAWLGSPPGAISAQIEGYRQAGSNPSWLMQTDADPLIAGDSAEVAERLAAEIESANADALNLRLHLPGLDPAAVLDQIARVGQDVLPRLRAALAG